MRYITLPHTDLRVAQIALGTAGLGSVTTQQEAFAVLDAYVEAGGTLVDTAHVYANWVPGERSRSEKTIGQWLARRGTRNGIVIATKGCHEDPTLPEVPRVTPRILETELEESLRYLGLDYLDLYWLHRDDPTQPVDWIIETLNRQVDAGKIRYFGCSNWEPERIIQAQQYATAHGLRSFAASQILWTLAEPNPGAVTPVHALMTEQSWPFYQTAGLGVVAFTSQARGFFAKASMNGVESLTADLMQAFGNDRSLARLARAQEVAARHQTTVTGVVLAYLTSQPIPTVALVGTNTLEQLRDALSAPDLELDAQTVQYLRDGAVQ